MSDSVGSSDSLRGCRGSCQTDPGSHGQKQRWPSVSWATPAPCPRTAAPVKALSGNVKGCLAGWQCGRAITAIKLMLWAFYRCVK